MRRGKFCFSRNIKTLSVTELKVSLVSSIEEERSAEKGLLKKYILFKATSPYTLNKKLFYVSIFVHLNFVRSRENCFSFSLTLNLSREAKKASKSKNANCVAKNSSGA